jgi:S-methylmethionine-dependent homocysteine/selenocysteine methylase
MINCAHPTHFSHSLDNPTCRTRLKGIRANASSCSHEELDNAETLDDGNPHELGQQFADLIQQFPQINVLGGCCGTDHRHIEQIAKQCLTT